MISHHHGLVFVHVPKCAGMAVEAALGGLPERQRAEQHFTGHQYAQYYPDAWHGFHKFAVVRDPITRCLSYVRFIRRWDAVWRRHLAHVPEETLLRDLLMSVNLLTSHNPGRMLTGDEEVLRMEELDTAWPAFADRFDLPSELPQRNKSPGSTQGADLSPTTRLMIAARFPEDWKYGYPPPSDRLDALPVEDQGPVLWARLLAWSLRHGARRQTTEAGAAERELEAWVQSLPEPSWRDRWHTAIHRRPPPLADEGNLTAWTEAIHEDIHAAVGLPLWRPWSPDA